MPEWPKIAFITLRHFAPMISTPSRRFSTALLLLVTSVLAACGGGSDKAASAGASAVATTTLSSGAFDTSALPGAPLTSGNVATDGSAWINYRRAQIGLSQLTQNSLIDAAAQHHSDYQRLNNTIAHAEVAGKNGFTGIQLDGRLASVGLNLTGRYAYGEVISATTNTSGFFMAEELITAIYHRFVIFEPVFKEVGTGSATTDRNYTYFTADFLANKGFGPGLGRGRLVSWPISGQTAVPPNFFSNQEEPDPVDTADEVGYPVSVHADSGTVITVNSFTIKRRNGAILPVKLLQNSTDTLTPTSAAAIIPLSPLAAATVYDVAFSGSADGVAVTLNWSFTTR
jgi:uncharacterized protein YkwD